MSDERSLVSGEVSDGDLVLAALRRRPRRAAFVAELRSDVVGHGATGEGVERALEVLETSGEVLVRPHYCADPHLAALDLRVVGLVEASPEAEGGDPISGAVERVERTWREWEAEFLANHRCS